MSTTTMSISLDVDTRNDIEELAKSMRMSRSDVIRSLVSRYRLERDLKKVSDLAKSKIKKFNITTWDELEELLG
jgi:predicted transcriptional regulator